MSIACFFGLHKPVTDYCAQGSAWEWWRYCRRCLRELGMTMKGQMALMQRYAELEARVLDTPEAEKRGIV